MDKNMKQADNEKIGAYLDKRIKEKFKYRRRFCRAYLLEQYGEGKYGEEDVTRLSNRITSIVKGTKGLQLYDLPYFSRLLGMSYDEILSAGACRVPDPNRLNNYQVAGSHDRPLWESYAKQAGDPILNQDENEKTVIDYAVDDFKNYEFLRYLMEKGYIRLMDDEEQLRWGFFGIETSIRIKKHVECRDINEWMAQRDELRRKVIVLAMEHQDFDMLTKLRAREIPPLYTTSSLRKDGQSIKQYYQEDLVVLVAQSGDGVLDYFAQEFTITDQWKRECNFLFPFFGELLTYMLSQRDPRVKLLLERAIDHNRQTLRQLDEQSLEAARLHSYHEILEKERARHNPLDEEHGHWIAQMEDDLRRELKRNIDFLDGESIVRVFLVGKKPGLVTNIIHLDATSPDPTITSLIDQLNASYAAVRDFEPRLPE